MTPDGRNLSRLWWLAATALLIVILLAFVAGLPPEVGDGYRYR